ncbi:hypothetical protein [Lacinutrix sp.]|uniref:hypothetical protein n=1 Tax=Lacinutrix sp. TaxID=1937692 RepID=UPI0025BDC530|nr:hypothetical protein [Lacinutrix sp.]
MKNIHNINKGLIITNIILGFTIYFGLLFLIPLGISQIIMAIRMVIDEKKLTKEITSLLTIYCISSTLVLIILFFMYTTLIPGSEGLFLLIMIISVLLAFLHLYITYLVKEMITNKNQLISKHL